MRLMASVGKRQISMLKPKIISSSNALVEDINLFLTDTLSQDDNKCTTTKNFNDIKAPMKLFFCFLLHKLY